MNGNPLPWVTSAKYLGNRLTNKIDGLTQDIVEKRARYIERNCELNQEFPYAHPELKCKLNNIYNSSFSGSVLWDLTSTQAKSIINSWSVSVKHMWDIPIQSHRYLIEPLGGTHLKTMLYSRFVKFIWSIECGNKMAAKLLLEMIKYNTETITGRNMKLILMQLDKRDIESVNNITLKNLKFCELPKTEEWRISSIKELTNIRQGKLCVQFDQGIGMENNETEDILEFLACS